MKNFKLLSTIIAATLLLVACEAEELNLNDETPQNLVAQDIQDNPTNNTDGEDDMPGQDGDLTDGEDDMPGEGILTTGEEGSENTDGEDDMPGQG